MKHLPKPKVDAELNQKETAQDKLQRAIDRRREKIGVQDLGNYPDPLQQQGKPGKSK